MEMKIEVKKTKKEEMEKQGVFSWPTWEKEVSRFDWHYDNTEECYLLEGKVVVATEDSEGWNLGKGILLHFQRDCPASGTLRSW
jgi:hypothetical protein